MHIDPVTDFNIATMVAGAIRLDRVESAATEWLWPGRIPLRCVTLLASDPGLGKSLLTLDIAARLSRGTPWPDASPSPLFLPPSSTILLTAEDDLASTVRPRLEAMGADCARIVAVPLISDHPRTPFPLISDNPENRDMRVFDLKHDLVRIERLLLSMPECRLIVVDPISAYLGSTNEHSNAAIQSLIVPLAQLARKFNVAVIAVNHLRKKEGAAIHRTMGSLAFVAAARAAWVLTKDPEVPGRRLFLPLKHNLAPDATGLAFTIESLPLPPDEGRGEGASSSPNRGTGGPPVLSWCPDPIPITAESIVGIAGRPPGRPDDERRQLCDWLISQLANGAQPADEVKEKSAALGYSDGTLRRAFRDLGGEAVRRGPFPIGEWFWQLPAVDAQNPRGELCASTQKPDDSARHRPTSGPAQFDSLTPADEAVRNGPTTLRYRGLANRRTDTPVRPNEP